MSKDEAIRAVRSPVRRTQLSYRKQGKCEHCGKRKLKTATLCTVCVIEYNALTRKTKRTLSRQGRCTQCGADQLASRSLCADCLKKHNGQTVAIRQERRETGLCVDYGSKAGGFARCEDCRTRQKQLKNKTPRRWFESARVKFVH
ncbi:MAG: hypothetical protein JO185_14425 [Acidobacteriaceae bacterium]|nr:hypothetical protein [Acidobacteriaceae bacterium]MBV9677530.1 hypothetical protein [Acidobacteriaceae bacterium]